MYQKLIGVSDMKQRFSFDFFPYRNTPYPGTINGIHSSLLTDLSRCNCHIVPFHPCFTCTWASYSVPLVSVNLCASNIISYCRFIISLISIIASIHICSPSEISWLSLSIWFFFSHLSFRIWLSKTMKSLLEFGLNWRFR